MIPVGAVLGAVTGYGLAGRTHKVRGVVVGAAVGAAADLAVSALLAGVLASQAIDVVGSVDNFRQGLPGTGFWTNPGGY